MIAAMNHGPGVFPDVLTHGKEAQTEMCHSCVEQKLEAEALILLFLGLLWMQSLGPV